jgi:hypothetical protein
METLDVQTERLRRFSSAATAAGPVIQGQIFSSHASLIEIDVRRAYCAGAWISVIVLACTAVEAQARQVATQDYSARMQVLFGEDPDLQWLRDIRNEIVHAGEPGTPSLLWKVDGAEIGANHAALEPEATRAVEIMFKFVYGRSWRQSTNLKHL